MNVISNTYDQDPWAPKCLIGRVMYDPECVMLCSSPRLPQATFIPVLNEFISSKRSALDQRALK